MIDLALSHRRFNATLEEYLALARTIKTHLKFLTIGKYEIDMEKLTCTCQDFKFNGKFTPCKHLFVGLIYQNSLNHDS